MENAQDSNLDNEQALLMLCLFSLSNQREWEILRTYYAEQDTPPQELTDFFNRVFNVQLPIQRFSPDTLFYRARRIASNDVNHLGVSLTDISNEICSIIMSDEDFASIKQMDANGSLYINTEDFFQVKLMSIKEFTPEQLSCIEDLRKNIAFLVYMDLMLLAAAYLLKDLEKKAD